MRALKFDVKTSSKLVYKGKVVMSATERPYLQMLLSQFENTCPRSVLEVGFGLGISAEIIQKTIHPVETHDIVEIEFNLFQDLCAFSLKYPTIIPIYGDCYSYDFKRTYDFLFFDPYDYEFSDACTLDENELMEYYLLNEVQLAHRLLNPGGILCHPFFGNASLPELPGLELKNSGPVTFPGILLWDGTICDIAQIGYYEKPC